MKDKKRWMLYAMVLALIAPLVIAATFTFSPNPDGTVFQLTQGTTWTYDLNVSVPESKVIYSIEKTNFSSLTINPNTGVLNFTPDNDDVVIRFGSAVVIAKNRTNPGDGTAAFILFNITNINDPPNITAVSPFNESDPINFTTEIDELEPLYLNVTATDVDIFTYEGDTLNYTWYVDGVINKTVLNSTSLNATYIPDYLSAGPNASMIHNLSVKVTDRYGASDNYTWRVNVTDMNRPPWLNATLPDYFNWTEDTNLTNVFNLDDYFKDNDTDNYPLNYEVHYSRAGMTANITQQSSHNHSVSFHPDKDFFGTVIIWFNASDYMNSTGSNNVTLNVTPVNDAPIIEPISNQTAFVGAPFILGVNAHDVDDSTLYYTNNHTELFTISGGVISFIPTAAQIGNYTIGIWVDDGELNSSTSFNLQIMNNSIPILRPNPIPDAIWPEHTPYILYVNATDLDNDTMTFYSDFSAFSVSQADINSSFAYANFSFTPSQIHVGLHTIRIYVNDSHGAVNSTTYVLNISNQIDAPVLGPIPNPIITKINKTYTIYINATDTDLDIDTFYENSTYFNITNMTGRGTGYLRGLINFTPDHAGWEYVKIGVNDSTSLNNEIIILVNVTNNRAPYFTDVPGVLNCLEDTLCEYDIDAEDPDHDLLYYYNNDTSIFTINETTGLISFTPTVALIGNYTIYLNVTDGELWNSTNFTINITAVNDTPYFDPPIDTYIEWDSVYEGLNFFLVLNATDEENDILNFSNIFINETNLFNISIYNLTLRQALINFTPYITEVGNHTVNISVTDGNTVNTTTFMFEILFYNDPPVLTSWNASNGTYWTNQTNLTILETDTWTFTINATDPDLLYNDSLSYNWTLDQESVLLNQTEYDYSPGYFAQGNHTLNVSITDRWGKNISFGWEIEVLNVNRAPTFGKKEYLTEESFLSGTFINLTFQAGQIELANPPPYLSGRYTSEIIDMVEDNGNFKFSRLMLGATEPNGTNITFQTRSSQYQTTGFTNWSAIGNATGNGITSPSYQYFQYMISFRSNQSGITPTLANATVNYLIANLTRDEDVTVDPWMDLDDFFFDADGNTELDYNVSGNVHLEILINISNKRVSIYPESDWFGVETIHFTASDGNATARSNDITIIYNPIEDETQTQTNTVTKTVTRTSLKREEVRVFTPIKILYPGNITMYQNNTFKAPIIIKNLGNQSFRGVNLTYEAENPDIKAYFTVPYFDEIGVNEQKTTELIIESYRIFGTYEMLVKANVSDPVFSDTAKIYINSLEKAEGNKTAVNTKVAFTRDLLQRNPKCLELNEVLERAVEQIDLGDYDEASRLLDQVRTACNYLLEPPEKEVQSPMLLNALGNSLLFVFGFMLIGLTSLAGYFMYRRFGGKK